MDMLNIRALGREVELGELYDFRRDCFLNKRILDRLPATDVQTVQLKSSNKLSVHPSGDYASRFKALDVSGENIVSILCGLTDLKGCGKFLPDEGLSGKTIRYALVREIQTKMEMVNQKTAKQYFDKTELLHCKNATHVVVGLTWGAIAIVDFRYKLEWNDKEEDKRKVKAELEKAVQALKTSLEKPKSSQTYELGKFSFKTFDDTMFDDRSQNLGEVINFVKNLQSSLASFNNGKGKPVKYILMPLSKLCENDEQTFHKIDEKEIQDFLKFVDNFASAKKEANDLATFAISNRHCIAPNIVERVMTFSNNLGENENRFFSRIQTRVLSIREGNAKSCILNVLTEDDPLNWNSIEKIKIFIGQSDSIKKKTTFVEEIKKLGIKYIGKGDYFDTATLQRFREGYVLYYSETIKPKSHSLDDNLRYLKELFLRPTKHKIEVVIVDVDMRPDLSIEEGIAVRVFREGVLVSKDALTSGDTNSTAIPKPKIFNQNREKPRKIIVLKTVCPGLYVSSCSDNDHVWLCPECQEFIEYGFDNHFYCKCGSAHAENYSFTCNELHHGLQGVSFLPDPLKDALGKLKPLQDINILLLGETGVGKSTFLNAFVNYMSYETLEEAKKGRILHLVASEFMTSEVDDSGEYAERLIKIGHDENEDHTVGESTTQHPQSYIYQMGDKMIRFIDTPGIGDTRGTKYDDINFQAILSYLSNHEDLHGILILLKPNESKLTVTFRYCVKQLLTHLHRSASTNICFVFTNSRSTDYHAGDTFPILKKLLNELEDVTIPLKRSTMYFMDNESFRFLVLLDNCIKFDEQHHKNYAGSWDISVLETKRLLNYVTQLHPHIIKDTVSLNSARRMILNLTKPLADISQKIQANITVMADKENELKNLDLREKNLKKKLRVTYEVLKPKDIPFPRTVCVDEKCVKVVDISGVKQIFYVQVCHSHCFLKNVEPNRYPNPDLQQCACMGGTKYYCQKCTCSWEKHMHVYYIYENSEVEVKNDLIEGELIKHADIKLAKEVSLRNAQTTKESMEKEKEIITEVSAKFAGFLKANAIAPYNDAMITYLNHLIDMEELKVAEGGEKETMLGLKNMLASYREQVKVIDEAMKQSSKEKIKPDEISLLVQQLYNLKYNGDSLKKIVQTAERGMEKERRFQEKTIPPFNKKSKLSFGLFK